MPDDDDDAIPKPAEGQNNTESLQVLQNASERFRAALRITFAVVLAVLIMGHVALFSLHQALHSRVESQEHRLERLNQMLSDMLAANKNGEKIERIEQQVNGIESQMNDLTTTIKAQDATVAAEAEVAVPAPSKKKRG